MSIITSRVVVVVAFFSFFGTKTKSACIIFVLINIKMEEENKRHALYLRRHSKDCLFLAGCVVVALTIDWIVLIWKNISQLWDEVLYTISTSKMFGSLNKNQFRKWKIRIHCFLWMKWTRKNNDIESIETMTKWAWVVWSRKT